MAVKWFGVKTLCRTRAAGRPSATDRKFDPALELVEERVVLFRAPSFDAAISKAEAEASRYAKPRHRNPYGQWVITEFLGVCDAFELFDAPGQGVEVFSTTILVQNSATRAALVERWYGAAERVPDPKRMKFLNAAFSRPARATPNKRVKPTAAGSHRGVRAPGRRGLRASR